MCQHRHNTQSEDIELKAPADVVTYGVEDPVSITKEQPAARIDNVKTADNITLVSFFIYPF